MAQPKQAKRTLRLEDVPILSGMPYAEPNGDTTYVDGDRRWRCNAEGALKYYIRYQAGQGPGVTPYEEMYRGPRG